MLGRIVITKTRSQRRRIRAGVGSGGGFLGVAVGGTKVGEGWVGV